MSLYSAELLALASSMPDTPPLAAPTHEGYSRSLVCGSSLRVAFVVEDGMVTQYWQEVRACALGQASAAVFAQNIVGQNVSVVPELLAQMTALLKSDGPTPQAPFEKWELLRLARSFENRHDSILLPLRATLKALEKNAIFAG